MEYSWVQPTTNSCTTLHRAVCSYHSCTATYLLLFIALLHIALCMCVHTQTYRYTTALKSACACAHWAFTVICTHVREKPLIKFCSKNPACDGQHTTPSHNFIITVIKEKKRLTQPGNKREKPQVGYHFTSVVTLCSHIQAHTCSFW